ncbi:MAG: CoA-binding protein [Candidatus Micrarchaeaceae archaeon]
MTISKILTDYKVIAVVGCSRDGAKYSNVVAGFMKDAGYRIIPINPVADKILGEKAYKSIDELDMAFDIADVFRPGEEALGITKTAIAKGAKAIWLQEGIKSAEAKGYAKSKGIEFIQDKCIMKEYIKLFG